ncbi:MAG TPA: FkbM family methyltransferase [Paracoccaceae bacterium]|nr:FkbM family methyltransferase [Paracoccaceae bacterium]
MPNIFSKTLNSQNRLEYLRFLTSRYSRRIIGKFRSRSQSGYQFRHHKNLLLLLDKSSLVDRSIINDGSWEKVQYDYLMAALDDLRKRGDCVFLDIGSYWGLYGLSAVKMAVPEVHLFEAEPHNRAQLYAQLFLNKLEDKVTVHPYAVSDHEGVLNFRKSTTINDGNRGSAGVIETPGTNTFPVQCRSLDSQFSWSGRYIVAKLDVEGAESSVLEGMAGLIARNRVLMQIEVFDRNAEKIHEVANRLGLTFIRRIDVDDYFSNFDFHEPFGHE